MKLVVTQPFADHKVGDSITEPGAVAEVLANHPGCVVKTADDPKEEKPVGRATVNLRD